MEVAACPSRLPVLWNRDFMGTAGCQSCSVLKKEHSCKCDQLGDAVRLMHIPSSQWITSYWDESSKSLPGKSLMSCSDTSLVKEESPSESRLELSWGRGTFPATSWQKCSTNIHSLARVLLCLPGKQKEWELLLLQSSGTKI